MKNSFLTRTIGQLRREPDFVIGSGDAPYLRRWWIIPRNRWFNIYLHQFCRSDDDRALHDHPWIWMSLILKGAYLEHTPAGTFRRKAWRPRWGWPTQLHRVELHKKFGCSSLDTLYVYEIPVWTIFITGPKIREWGFACASGWKHWRDFIGLRDGRPNGGEIGPGCGE